MYAFIKGEVVHKSLDRVVLENNGIGYDISMPSTSVKSLPEGKEIKVYTYYYVTQDSISLYGFSTLEDKSMFEKLISVSKIGAKTAIGILGSISANEFALAVITDDVKRLSKLPGIGNKTAQRLIIEIKDKLETKEALIQSVNEYENTKTLFQNISDKGKMEDVMEALSILGYSNKQIAEVVSKLDSTKDTEELIKDALKHM